VPAIEEQEEHRESAPAHEEEEHCESVLVHEEEVNEREGGSVRVYRITKQEERRIRESVPDRW